MESENERIQEVETAYAEAKVWTDVAKAWAAATTLCSPEAAKAWNDYAKTKVEAAYAKVEAAKQ